MNAINFLLPEQRREGHSLQYNYERETPLSFWLADMDISTPQDIIDALSKQIVNLGYSYTYGSYFEAISEWFLKRFNVNLDTKKVSYSPSVLYSIRKTIEELSIDDEQMIILEPYYSGYSKIFNIEKVQRIPLGSSWFSDLERMIAGGGIKAVLVCNPHNPTGKIFNYQELNSLVTLCSKAGVWILSDEIHMDFAFKKFTPLISFDYEKIITYHSVGKTFNLSGTLGSYFLTNSKQYKQCFELSLEKDGLENPNLLNLVCTEIGYTKCNAWLDSVKNYIFDNFLYLQSNLNEKLEFEIPDGTYCIWIDYSRLQITEKVLKERLSKNGMRVMLGSKFVRGDEEMRYFRLNLACDREKLKSGIRLLNEFSNL